MFKTITRVFAEDAPRMVFDEDHLRAYRMLHLPMAMKILWESEATTATLRVRITVVLEGRYLPDSTNLGLGLGMR